MEPWEETLTLSRDSGEAEFKHLGEVLRLTDLYTVPADHRICNIPAPAVGCHILASTSPHILVMEAKATASPGR